MQRRAAFTLVELLVVIGIIAVLIAILLPTLAAAREQAKRIQCQSNLRTLGQGLMMYLNQSKGMLPIAPKNATNQFDAWYYRSAAPNNLANLAFSPIGRVLKLHPQNYQVLICPSDQNAPLRTSPNYIYSYVFNRFFNGNASNHPAIKKITECQQSAEKIILYEEDGATIDDGNGELWSTNWNAVDLLSIRHDERNKRTPDKSDPGGVPNAKRKGNCLFADGHAEFVPRSLAHAKRHAAPQPRRANGTEILILSN